ncbi:hypothetical protein GGX14DRAFT_543727 [Mycena pura]|uniref:Uncharacterized protein n=1 Tax=Mycena pura TaxID=153505 RepID=A0AAD6V9U7_9AGAR|nr:hypothetical protein GGX14DRAFT_543727 [Mycena pura]
MGKHLLCQWCFAADRIGLAAPPAPWKFIAFDIGIGQARDLGMPMVTWQYLHLRNQTGHLFQLYTILISKFMYSSTMVIHTTRCGTAVLNGGDGGAAHHKHTGTSGIVTSVIVTSAIGTHSMGNTVSPYALCTCVKYGQYDAWPHLGIGASGIITSVIIASVIGTHSMGLRVLLRLCTVCINVKYAVQWSFILQDVALQCLTEVTKATVRRQKWNEMNGS